MAAKNKRIFHIVRSAAMSALIISAIVGNGADAPAADNSSTLSTGRVYSTSSGGNTSALKANGGTLYVDSEYTTNNKDGDIVHMGPNAANAWVAGGSIIVGQTSAGLAAPATLTTDNMTIDAGLVDVTNDSTLTSVGDIAIKGGTLRMAGNVGSTVHATKVSINTGATLHAASGLENVVNTHEAVDLRGGTIIVERGGEAALTIGAAAAEGAEAGRLYVASDYIFNAYGGTIKADLINSGTTNFIGGTTTVDNLTATAGKVTVTSGADVKSLGAVTISDGTLDMQGGTLTVQGSVGALEILGGALHSSAHVNTINANVMQTGGTITVDGKSQLLINKNLDVSNTGHINITGGASLSVAGTTTLAANTVTVGDAASAEAGIFSITKDSLLTKSGTQYTANAGIAKDAITLSQGGGATVTNQGLLILTGWSGEVDMTTDFATDALAGIRNPVLGNMLSGNNVILMGATLKGVDARMDGGINTGTVMYGSSVTVNAATGGSTFTNDGTIVVPKLVAGAKMKEFINNSGNTTLLGTGASDSSTSFTTFTQSGSGATVVMDSAGLTATKVGISAGSMSIESASTLNATNLHLNGTGLLSVTNSTANIGTLRAAGGTLFIDPASVNVGNISGTMGAKMLTGAGSVLAVGGVQGWVEKPMQDASFSFGNPEQAVLGLAPSATIKVGPTGVVVVDASVRKNPNTPSQYLLTYTDFTTDAAVDQVISAANVGAFWAGDTSLTVIDASGLNARPVFDLTASENKTVNIAHGAKLHVTNLTVDGLRIFSSTTGTVTMNTADGTVNAVKNSGGSYDSTAPNAGWTGTNLIQPDRMLTANMTNTGTLEAKVNEASAVLGMSSEYNSLMYGVWDNALNNTNAPNMGLRFVSRAASTDYGLSAKQAAQSIEGAAQMGAVAGVQGVTMGASNAVSKAVSTRISFTKPLMDKAMAGAMHMDSEGAVSQDAGLNAGDGMKDGMGLWIMPLYQSSNTWGMKSGAFSSGYNSDLGGVALGADCTLNDMFRFGAAFNMGAGNSQSSGDFNSTNNNFTFWGINFYGGWAQDNFGITADVGYTANYNKVKQDLPASLQMHTLKSDITSAALNSGLKGEYRLVTPLMDVVPHVGLRYLSLSTDQYKVKGGETLFTVEQESQSIWTFPLGVTLSRVLTTDSQWAFKPQADFSVIPAAGDVKVRSKSRISGVPGSAEATMQVVDHLTLGGGLGLDVSNDSLSLGLNYNIQAAEHRTDHGVFGTLRYEF